MTRHTNLIAGVLFVTCYGLAAPAHAQEVTALDEDNIREFIQKTADITTGHDFSMTDKEKDIYLDVHISPDAHFKSTMRYTIPGFDIQETTLSLDKEGFIEDVHKATQSVSDYESQIEISDIKISDNKKSATVKTRTLETGSMPVSDNIEQQNVPMEGMSTCTQILTLSDENAIQMYNANCVTDIHFKTFEP